MKEIDEELDEDTFSEDGRLHPHGHHHHTAPNETTALLDNETLASVEPARRGVAGGTVLGIHNLSISFPQFIVGLLCRSRFMLLLINYFNLGGDRVEYYFPCCRRDDRSCWRYGEYLLWKEWRCLGVAIWRIYGIGEPFRMRLV